MPDLEMEARAGFFGKSAACRLTQEHVDLTQGGQTRRIGYAALSAVRIHRHRPGQAMLGLSSGDETVTIRLVPPSRSEEEIAAFTAALIDRVAQVAPTTPLQQGPSRLQWIAAWIGVIVSGAILLASVWTLAIGGAVGPLLLPVGIALANFGVVLPILKAGKPRVQEIGQAATSRV